MLEKASCLICTAHYAKGEVAALLCGHTFHLACIERWLTTSKTCPSCRKTVREKQIVKQLFFNVDENDEGDTFVADTQSTYEKLEHLTLELQLAKQDLIEQQKAESLKEAKIISCQDELTHVRKLLALKEKAVNNMSDKMRWLEMGEEDRKQKEKECEKLKDALRACEFYNRIMKKRGEEEGCVDDLQKYCKKGDIQPEQYCQLLKKDLERIRERLRERNEESQNLKKENAKLISKQRDMQNMIKALTEELEETRASCNKNTPYNPKLKPMLDRRSPIKRISMGFDDSFDLNNSVFESAIRKKAPSKPIVIERAASINEIRDLEHFCELADTGIIEIEDANEQQSKDVVQLTDGSYMHKRSYEARNDPTPDLYISKTKKAHLRMEAENEQRKMNEAEKITTKRAAVPRVRRVNIVAEEPKAKNARLSAFFRRQGGKIDLINID